MMTRHFPIKPDHTSVRETNERLARDTLKLRVPKVFIRELLKREHRPYRKIDDVELFSDT